MARVARENCCMVVDLESYACVHTCIPGDVLKQYLLSQLFAVALRLIKIIFKINHLKLHELNLVLNLVVEQERNF